MNIGPCEKLRGKNHFHWSGGEWIDYHGYKHIYMPTHPYNNKNYVLEHRLVMEKHLGRCLRQDEEVHHKNEDRLDNRLENLELLTKAGHSKHHLKKLWDEGIARQRNFNHKRDPKTGLFVKHT